MDTVPPHDRCTLWQYTVPAFKKMCHLAFFHNTNHSAFPLPTLRTCFFHLSSYLESKIWMTDLTFNFFLSRPNLTRRSWNSAFTRFFLACPYNHSFPIVSLRGGGRKPKEEASSSRNFQVDEKQIRTSTPTGTPACGNQKTVWKNGQCRNLEIILWDNPKIPIIEGTHKRWESNTCNPTWQWQVSEPQPWVSVEIHSEAYHRVK